MWIYQFPKEQKAIEASSLEEAVKLLNNPKKNVESKKHVSKKKSRN